MNPQSSPVQEKKTDEQGEAAESANGVSEFGKPREEKSINSPTAGEDKRPLKQAAKVLPAETAPNNATAASLETRRLSRKRRRAVKRLQQRVATSVYVTNIPNDASEEELSSYFLKCGILLPDSETGRPRIKLYVDENTGERKGDGLVTYALAPSVDNAITLLDNVPLRYGGQPMRVQPASFDHKDDSERKAAVDRAVDASTKRPRRAAASRAIVEQALSWADGGRGAHTAGAARMVVLKGVFDVASPDLDYALVRQDMAEGCGEIGKVEKITVFEGNAEGVVSIRFESIAETRECIRVMDGRWYDGRQLSATFYDGSTDYRVCKEGEDEGDRDKRWQRWLEGGDKEGQA